VDELVVLKQTLVLEAHVIGNRVARIFDALEQLKRLSELRFHHALPSPEATNRWFEESGFGIDQHGFVHPAADAPCNSILSFAWGRDFTSNNQLQARLFAINSMGPDIRTIRDRLDGVAWCYYQDALNGTLVYPKLEIHNVIPSDFDWRTYHPYLTVEPGVNPDRRICWTAPNIDYGGEGLITIASIPVYIKDHFVGLWSIDVPIIGIFGVQSALANPLGHILFLCDSDGVMLSHPSLHHQIDKSKGTLVRKKLADLGGEFVELEASNLIKLGSGQLRLSDADDQVHVCLFEKVKNTDWLVFLTVPEESLVAVAHGNLRDAFRRIMSGDFSYRVHEKGDSALQKIMTEYNRMAAALEDSERERSERLAQSEAIFRAVTSSASDAIVSTNELGVVIVWNSRAEQLFGYTEAEIIGRSMDVIVPNHYRNQHREGVKRLRATGEPRLGNRPVELEAQHVDGRIFPIELTLSIYRVDGRLHYTAIIRDITERRRVDAQLRLYADELRKKNRELETSHEELLDSNRQLAQLFAVFVETLPGSELDGKYLIGKRLGSGGFSVVYSARELATDRLVAIKILRPNGGLITTAQIERFKREAAPIFRIKHPNAVEVLDSGVSTGRIPYIVMELLFGCSLSQALREQGRLSLRRCIDIVLSIADVLIISHEQGIIHRDIKPDNVFLHRDLNNVQITKVLDFGIARLIEDSEDESRFQALTGTGQIIGTPHYIAPERISGQGYDGKADVYSLGVLFYECITGQLPFGGRNPSAVDVFAKHLTQIPRSPREINPTIPFSIDSIIQRMLMKDSTERPTAQSVANELRQAVLEIGNDWLPVESASDEALVSPIAQPILNTQEGVTPIKKHIEDSDLPTADLSASRIHFDGKVDKAIKI